MISAKDKPPSHDGRGLSFGSNGHEMVMNFFATKKQCRPEDFAELEVLFDLK